MAVVLALPYLFDEVSARFTREGTAAYMTFGWLETARQIDTGNRIVWTPGDRGGNVGAVAAAKYPGRNPRALATLEELFTCEITASDPAAPDDERAQYVAARLLYDAWLRAVYLAAVGTFRVVSAEWVGGDRARRHGATIRAVCTVQAVVPDLPIALAPVDAGAALAVQELDVTETETLAGADA